MSQNMYIGPNVQKLGLLRNQVYIDGVPGQVRAALVQIPELQELIVPIDGVSESIRKTRTRGEHLHHVYEEVLRKSGVKA